MEDIKSWHIEQMLERTVAALKANLFDAVYFKEREALFKKVESFAKKDSRVGFGGSVTIRSLGLIERLKERGAITLDHWQEALTPEEVAKKRIEQLTSDLFISSVNAITENGEIVNIDGLGNRTNSITFGPKKIILIAGYNKVVPDLEAAIHRIKNVAAPMNAKRLGLNLPCAKTGYCHDCKSEARICRVISILQRRPMGSDISVFLINEEIGF